MLRFLTLVTAALVTAARPGPAMLHPHGVESINTAPVPADAQADPNTVGIVTFYSSTDCTGTPGFLNTLNATCYGPVKAGTSFKIVSVADGCDAFARQHPCSSNGQKLTNNNDGINCYTQLGNGAPDIDITVQCDVHWDSTPGDAPPPPAISV